MSVTLTQWGRDRPLRPIPEGDKDDDDAIFVLQTSGWTRGHFHVDDEEEAEYNELLRKQYEVVPIPPVQDYLAEVPSSAPVTPQSPAPLILSDETPLVVAPGLNEFYHASVDDTYTEETIPPTFWNSFENASTPTVESYVQRVVEDACRLSPSTTPALNTAALPTPDATPLRSNTRQLFPVLTPELSPSNSPDSPPVNDSDFTEVFDTFRLPDGIVAAQLRMISSGDYSTPQSSRNALPGLSLFGGMTFLPTPQPTPRTSHRLQTSSNLDMSTESDLLASPCSGRKGRGGNVPLPGPAMGMGQLGRSNSSASAERTVSSIRRGRQGPYHRHRNERKGWKGRVVDINTLPPDVLRSGKCPSCPYLQESGAGSLRSFKRHLLTHREYKSEIWVCRGVLQSNGTYFGGCMKEFSRKDALQRHIKSRKETNCVTDFIPMAAGSEFDEDE